MEFKKAQDPEDTDPDDDGAEDFALTTYDLVETMANATAGEAPAQGF